MVMSYDYIILHRVVFAALAQCLTTPPSFIPRRTLNLACSPKTPGLYYPVPYFLARTPLELGPLS